MNRKRLLPILLMFSALIVLITISFAAWEIRLLENEQGKAESSLYNIQYHYENSNSQERLESLELNSGFDLLELKATQYDLKNHRYEFLGWKVGSDTQVYETSYIYTNFVSHSVKDLLVEYDETLTDNTIHLWECWSNQIPSDKVLLTITYDTDKLHYQLVNASSKYYLFNIAIPDYEAESFKYNDIDYSLNNYIDLATYGGKKVSLIAN